jgi:hypothetical protein
MRPLKLAGALWLCVLCFSMIGCMRVKEADVPGTYTAKADWGTSTLVFAKDHTFQQTVRLNSGEVKRMDGKWKLVGPGKNSVVYDITMGPCLDVKHDKQGVYAPWSFSSINPTLSGGLEIAADPDWGITYKKK